jgi:hypothetical protein
MWSHGQVTFARGAIEGLDVYSLLISARGNDTSQSSFQQD